MPTHPSHLQPDGNPDGTTRTRLPEGDPSARRPPARTSRSLVMVVGVVILLIAALAFATRGGSGSANNGSTSTGTGTGTGARAPEAAATAPTGQLPVTTQTEGIASGFPPTPEGAQSAAANYAVALGSNGMFNTEQRHQIIAAIHDPTVLNTIQDQLDNAYSASFLTSLGLRADGTAPPGLTFVTRTIPIGTKETASSGGTATVAVWCVGLEGLAGTGSTKPVTESWFTITENLKWVDTDWKIESSTQNQGPAPINGDNQAAGANEIANAVNGYGGFTYAR
ncbi:MAG: hypothetical protein JO362_14210 [Streptomycetaceae bacterium]|nr:hypothetical protein [Streptomycetaceae bacterium]